MKQCYTEETLVKFIYGECDLFERLEMENALEENLCLRENFDELFKSYKTLPKVKFAPQKATIDSILKHGKGNLQTTN